MSHPRIEEVSDSEPDEASDPSEGDVDDFDEAEIMQRVAPKNTGASSSKPPPVPPPGARSHLIDPANIPSSSLGRQPFPTAADDSDGGFEGGAMPPPPQGANYGHFAMLYPVYFDARRTRAEGRRVGRELAVANPLARTIVDACAALRLQTVFEPGKTHPKDWANPGRVRVMLKLPPPEKSKSKAGGEAAPRRAGDDFVAGQVPGEPGGVKNKHHLYVLVAAHLRSHPTTEASAELRLKVPGAPLPDASKPWPRPAVPRGWKMGELLPHYSGAVTGGGVSENLFKDMMKEMQNQQGAGAGGGGAPGVADMMSGMLAQGGAGGAGPSAGAIEEGGGKKKNKKGKGKG